MTATFLAMADATGCWSSSCGVATILRLPLASFSLADVDVDVVPVVLRPNRFQRRGLRLRLASFFFSIAASDSFAAARTRLRSPSRMDAAALPVAAEEEPLRPRKKPTPLREGPAGAESSERTAVSRLVAEPPTPRAPLMTARPA